MDAHVLVSPVRSLLFQDRVHAVHKITAKRFDIHVASERTAWYGNVNADGTYSLGANAVFAVVASMLSPSHEATAG